MSFRNSGSTWFWRWTFLPPHGLGGIVGGGGLGKTQLRRPSTIGRIQADDVEASTVAAATLKTSFSVMEWVKKKKFYLMMLKNLN